MNAYDNRKIDMLNISCISISYLIYFPKNSTRPREIDHIERKTV